jgi:hypothetical protein
VCFRAVIPARVRPLSRQKWRHFIPPLTPQEGFQSTPLKSPLRDPLAGLRRGRIQFTKHLPACRPARQHHLVLGMAGFGVITEGQSFVASEGACDWAISEATWTLAL